MNVTIRLVLKSHKNISLIYILTFLQNSLIWAPIWILFYLRFTDYAGIGILESMMIMVIVFGEIPTGALADLLGRRRTLVLAFLFSALGNLCMGLASDFPLLIVGVVVATLGSALSSGTVEALVYDTLLEEGKEKQYQAISGNMSSLKMLAIALSSVIGGWVYQLSPGLPFIVVAVIHLLGALLSLALIEPSINSEVFSFKNYIKQTKTGLKTLFNRQHPLLLKQNILLILMNMIIVMNWHSLMDIQLVDQGWDGQALGLITAAMYLLASVLSQSSKWLSHKHHSWTISLGSSVLVAVSMILIPRLGMILGTGIIMLRNGLTEIFSNAANQHINSVTESKYRATTLSTYNMLSNIFYVVAAYFMGQLMDAYSVNGVVATLGLALLVITLLAPVVVGRKAKESGKGYNN